jgi:hypothetical protein
MELWDSRQSLKNGKYAQQQRKCRPEGISSFRPENWIWFHQVSRQTTTFISANFSTSIIWNLWWFMSVQGLSSNANVNLYDQAARKQSSSAARFSLSHPISGRRDLRLVTFINSDCLFRLYLFWLLNCMFYKDSIEHQRLHLFLLLCNVFNLFRNFSF